MRGAVGHLDGRHEPLSVEGVMAFGDLVTCSRCSAKVHNQKAWCHNCAYPLTPADSTRAPLHAGRAPRPAGQRPVGPGANAGRK